MYMFYHVLSTVTYVSHGRNVRY